MQSQIEIFKFNPNTDYLPYFKKVFLEIDKNWTVLELLQALLKIEKFAILESERFCLKINDLFVEAKTKLDAFDDLKFVKIEPVSEYYCAHDLIVDTKNFWQQFEMFKKFETDSNLREIYNEKFLEYFASNTLNFNKNYIGEAAIFCIHHLIFNKNMPFNLFEDLILDSENGMLMHTCLKNQIIKSNENSQIFYDLLKIFYPNKSLNLKKIEFGFDEKITQNFENFNIAFYFLHTNQVIFKNLKYNKIELATKNSNLAFYCENSDFILKMAYVLLLEAVDKNCDFLVVDDEFLFDILDAKQGQIEAFANREIKLPILKIDEFVKIINGEKNSKTLGFDKHKIIPNFF